MTFFSSLQSKRRVVITGIGAVTPLGLDFASTWRQLLQQQGTAATTLEQALRYQGLDEEALQHELSLVSSFPSQVAAPVRYTLHQDPRTARFVQFALQAGREAMENAGLTTWVGEKDNHDMIYQQRRQRVGVCIGSGMSGMREASQALRAMEKSSYRKISPHFVPKVLPNSASGRLSILFGLQGPNHTASTACAAGTHAIGDALRAIQLGQADIMLAGGAEACIDPLSIAGFCRLRAVSTHFEDPQQASRPFDRHRDGFVMAEGAAILVCEEKKHAEAREAPILAELCGYGLTGDGNHITSPDPQGLGAELAMTMALKDAGIGGRDVDYVNAHATSTPLGDEIEVKVIDKVSGYNGDLLVSSTKGATGHLLGAAGALEAAFTVQTLVDQCVPPTNNLKDPVGNGAFQHVTSTTNVDSLQIAVSNSFGFGGVNASVVFRRMP